LLNDYCCRRSTSDLLLSMCFEQYVVDDVVDDIVEYGVRLFSGVSQQDRCVHVATKKCETLVYQFGHIIKFVLVASDYDTGLGEAVVGRHFEAAPGAWAVMQDEDFRRVLIVMQRPKKEQ
jgi:hypothetical protein